MDRFIPLSVPNFEGNEVAYVSKAVAEGWVSTGGACITELENRMAAFLHVEKAVACQSGTAAIHLALIESGVMPQDAVFVPTLTFIAAVNPVKYQFAEPIFVDCDDSLCMDPEKLERYCKEECIFEDGVLRTKVGDHPVKAIVVVHVFGNMADMERIMEVAKKYNLKVIEDATEALGTKYLKGKYAGNYAGTIGDFGAYSFNGNKIITTGGGGMLVAKDLEKANHAAYLSTQAKDDHLFYVHNEIGYNYRMTNVQAAIGVAQMEELEEFIARKQRNFEYYCKKLEDIPQVYLKPFREGTSSNSWFYALEINVDNVNIRRIVEKMEEKGVGTRPIWGLIAEQKPYEGAMATDLSCAREYAAKILNIPCSTNITHEDMDHVVEAIKQTINEVSQ